MITETQTQTELKDMPELGGEFKRLAQQSSHYLAGLVGSFLIGFISFPVFTRVFSVAEYGLIDLAQRVILMLTIGCKAGLQNAVLRFYEKERFAADPAAERRYYSTMFLGVAGIAVTVAGIYLGIARLMPSALVSGSLKILIYFISILVVLRALTAILLGFLRIEERTRAYNLANVCTRTGTVAVVCILLGWLGRRAQTYFTGSLIAESTLVAILIVGLLRRRVLSPAYIDKALFRTGVMFGMPLVAYEFAFAVLGSADRFLVRYYLGSNSLGFYSVAYGLAQNANDLLITPLGLAILPIYMRLWNSHGPRITVEFLTTSLELFLVTAAGVLAIAAAVAHPLVVLLASSKYAGVDELIPILLAGLLIYATYIFVTAGLLIHKRTMQMAGLLVISAVVNIALNCLLLPRMGLTGSAVATVLSYACCILLLARASNRYLPLHLRADMVAKYVLAAAAAWLIGSRVELGTLVGDLLARATLTLAVYLGCLYALDSRARRLAVQALAWGRSLL